MKPTPRTEVYMAIDGEREYQHKACVERNWTEHKSIGEYLLVLDGLVQKAKTAWYVEADADAKETMNNFRKIAGVAVACMEDHGAPQR